jgi:hypothetical protein
VCPLGCPLHLLAFHEPLAHDLINRGFHKGGTKDVPLTIAFAEVGDELLVIANVGGLCRKVDSNIRLSTISSLFNPYTFQYMVWCVNFATEPPIVCSQRRIVEVETTVPRWSVSWAASVAQLHLVRHHP